MECSADNNLLNAKIYLADPPNRTRGADRFVEEYISILSFTLPGRVIHFYHVGFVVFVEHLVQFVVVACLPRLLNKNKIR